MEMLEISGYDHLKVCGNNSKCFYFVIFAHASFHWARGQEIVERKLNTVLASSVFFPHVGGFASTETQGPFRSLIFFKSG